MKNALKGFLLWQNKRNELPVNNDPQADWDQMQSFLNEHMPVVKKPGGFKGFRTLPAILITFSAAAMIYLVGNIYNLQKHKHEIERHFHKGNPTPAGSHFAGSPDSTGTNSDTGHLLPRGKNATVDSSGHPAVSNNNNPSAKAAPAGDAKNANGLTASNKPGQPVNGANPHPNPSSAAQQNARPLESSIADNKTQASRRGRAHHHSTTVIPGQRNGGRNTAAENKPGSNSLNNNNPGQTAAAFSAFNYSARNGLLAMAAQPVFKFDLSLNKIQPSALPVLNSRLGQMLTRAGSQTSGSKKGKADKPQNSQPSNIDWGVIIGVNTSGSFTPKSQNANFYGSAPVDPWFGLFASVKLNTNWAIAPEVHFFSPQNIITTYSHANQSKVDSGQSLAITASRKMYAVSVPIYLVYNMGNGLQFKTGPVIDFPVKQINTSSVLLPYTIRTDTSYYKNISAVLNATQYRQNINFGFAVGAAYQFRRFIFGATYLKCLSGYGISSGLGAYKSYNGTFQFSIGFQLDKGKP